MKNNYGDIIASYLDKIACWSLLHRQEIVWFSLGMLSILILKAIFQRGGNFTISKSNKRANFTIILKDNNIEKAIKKMKNKMTKLGLMKTFRDNKYYQKPSEIKVLKAKEGRINLYKAKKKREANL